MENVSAALGGINSGINLVAETDQSARSLLAVEHLDVFGFVVDLVGAIMRPGSPHCGPHTIIEKQGDIISNLAHANFITSPLDVSAGFGLPLFNLPRLGHGPP